MLLSLLLFVMQEKRLTFLSDIPTYSSFILQNIILHGLSLLSLYTRISYNLHAFINVQYHFFSPALMKDVPDAIGDAKFNIRSFTVRIGQNKVFTAMQRLLTALFFGVGLGFVQLAFFAGRETISMTSSSITTLKNSANIILRCCRILVALCAFGAGMSVWKEAQNVNAEDSGEVYTYYMHLWKLFYASYLVLPFAR